MKRATPSNRSKSSPKRTDFTRRIIRWHKRHGRRDLPWQVTPTPYRVWVSEVMLQQTQVATVIPYFTKFIERFPDVRSLAAAELDAVLGLWSGLGYYARARNLHRAARLIFERHGGAIPDQIQDLVDLPGIGRSTAGAILALSGGGPHPILDGNVKRVLCRYYAIAGWPGDTAIEARLWKLASMLVPRRNAAAYTQAVMDLGATVCARSRPQCPVCPVNRDCAANRHGTQNRFPQPRPRQKLPLRRTIFALIENESGAILLERRPEAGIWGGLWSLPECPQDEEPVDWVRRRFDATVEQVSRKPPLRHTFTHFHLHIQPVHFLLSGCRPAVNESGRTLWYEPGTGLSFGVASPVRKLIGDLHKMPQGGNS